MKNSSVNNLRKNHGCVIMASGLGVRFGGNKLMAEFNGKPMIQHILDITDNLFKSRVVVTRNCEVKALCEAQNIPVIFHEFPYRSDTIRLGLKSIKSDIDGCMFCLADQPLLTRKTIETILENTDKDLIVKPVSSGKPGSPVWFSNKYFDELLNLPQDLGGNYVAKKHSDSIKFVEINNEYEFQDMDTRALKDFYEQLTIQLGSFLISGKRHIVITGNRGSGKTTLFNNLMADKLPGLTSWVVRGDAVYIKENGQDEKHIIGLYDDSLIGKINMRINPDGFTSFAIPVLDKLINSDNPWISIDEIGFLETGCPSYIEKLEEAFSKKHVIAVVRKQDLPFLNAIKFREDVYLIDKSI